MTPVLVCVIAATMSGCELAVQLDRNLVDAGAADVTLGSCPICSDASPEDGAADAMAGDAGALDSGGTADSGSAHDADAAVAKDTGDKG